MASMTLVKFREIAEGAPIDDEELACRASDVSDHAELSLAAQKFLHAKQDFESALDEINFERC